MGPAIAHAVVRHRLRAVRKLMGRIWVLMFAHAAFDLTALWMIYWNLETSVAHLVFK